MKSIVTIHAKNRAKQRLGISKGMTNKIADKALKYGICHKDTKGKFKSYIDKLYLIERQANNIRIYNRKIYLFHNDVLITILNLPNMYLKVADKIQKRNTLKENIVHEHNNNK